MSAFFIRQLDYIFCFYGMSFLVLALVVRMLSREARGLLPWFFLGAFALTHGINEWLDMLRLAVGSHLFLDRARCILAGASFVFLAEFGRRGILKRETAWIHLPLAAIGLGAALTGFSQLEIGMRYGYGLVGGILAAWTLWRASLRFELHRTPLRIAAVALFGYALVSGAVVQRGVLWPSTVLNYETFLRTTGIPVQLLRGTFAFTIAAALWFLSEQLRWDRIRSSSPQNQWSMQAFAVPLMAVILLAGWWFTEFMGRERDKELLGSTLQIARTAAGAIDSDRLRSLRGAGDDNRNPDYVRLSEQVKDICIAQNNPSRLRLYVQRGGQFIAPVSFDESHRPWTIPEKDLARFYAFGTVAEQGSLLEEGIPVLRIFITLRQRGSDNRAIGLLAWEIETRSWQGSIEGHRLQGIWVTLFVCVLLMVLLYAHFNSLEQMVAVERRSQELEQIARQSEKLSAIGQLAAGVAHEINNPLGIILGFAQSANKRIQASDALSLPLKSIEREAMRCKELVQNLLAFSRQNKPRTEEVDLNETVTSTLSMIEAQARVKAVEVFKELGVLQPLLGDKNQLQQVIVNLCNNAIDAMPNGGKITVRTKARSLYGDQRLILEIEDTGSGIPEDIQDKIFNPFFTTKEVGKGTGLGLSLVHEIIQRHKGTIQLRSEVGKGATFIVSLPAKGSKERPRE